MESRAKILGHPIHQMLIPFPFGLLATAVIFDIVWLFTTTLPRTHIFALVAFWMTAAGIVGGIVASPFGLIDWLAIPTGTRAKSVGLLHGVGNLAVLVLFALSLWLRYTSPLPAHQPTTLALVLSFAGFALAGLTGWLGGELVDRLGVGVDDGAHLNAPNSLTHSSARGDAGGQVI
ncbi:MAG TPA: DUF2231 domain-containing protein [Pyrinomonadaceae bacterium]|jgi:uncharacterized membrane protein|nr:DUF2231 domain-containing protein [Pyrinomonadaceae bacterium]